MAVGDEGCRRYEGTSHSILSARTLWPHQRCWPWAQASWQGPSYVQCHCQPRSLGIWLNLTQTPVPSLVRALNSEPHFHRCPQMGHSAPAHSASSERVIQLCPMQFKEQSPAPSLVFTRSPSPPGLCELGNLTQDRGPRGGVPSWTRQTFAFLTPTPNSFFQPHSPEQ